MEGEAGLVKAWKAGKACFQELEKLLPSYRKKMTKSIPTSLQVREFMVDNVNTCGIVDILCCVTLAGFMMAEVNPAIIYSNTYRRYI